MVERRSNIHVIFGTGALGRAVMRELNRKGASVRMVNRIGQADGVSPEVEMLAADAYNLESAERAVQDASVVYQCAQPPYHQWQQKFPALQANILAAASAVDAKLVIGENLYMYGDTKGQPISEDLPYNAHTRKGRTRAEMAQAALEAHRAGKLRVTIGRGSDFFGPWAKNSTMGERVFYPAIQGKKAQLVGRDDLPHTHTYIEDFGKALVLLGERTEADGQVWHVPNDHPRITQGEFLQIVFEEIGLPPKYSVMGKTMMRLGGMFIPEARESVEMMYEFEEPFIVDSSKIEREFGLKATPLRESIKQTLDWYRAHPNGSFGSS